MRTVVLHLVAASSLLLALPPGWCRGLPGQCLTTQGTTNQAPERATCCCHQRRHKSLDSVEAPNLPLAKCCCTRDTVPPKESVLQSLDLGASTLAVTTELAAVCRSSAIDPTTPADLRAGPPVRILQGVWRL